MRKNNRQILDEHILKDCFSATLEQDNLDIAVQQLRGDRGLSVPKLNASIDRLTKEGLIQSSNGRVRLTKQGELASAAIIRRHRIWETFLATELRLEEDHLHRDAEIMEHILTDDLVDEYDRKLNFPKKDPHGSEIPRNITKTIKKGLDK